MRSLLLPALLWATLTAPALAQSIIPAADGTGTLVMPDGSTYQITGGTLSGDGATLFHSFEQFGLTAAEVANFLADPTVQNILGRVVGGNASVIDGLVQVSGSSANLYLLNPAGILFGPNSALNLDGSFTATTASGVGFGENWLQAVGDTNYAALTGNPTAFAFGSEPGALINAGNLAVNPGEVITLASGSVINLGTLTAPGGQIIVLAVPGENRVSIRPEGAILGLELATLPEEASPLAPLPFSPLDIPSLLRAGQPEVATGIAVNPDGTVSLTGSAATLPTTPGTALVSGTVNVAGETGGEVQVLGDRIAVTAAIIDASGTQGGGRVLVGGDYQGGGTTPTSDRTYVSPDSQIRADTLNRGDGGQIIVWADETTRFYGQINAQGGASGGDGGFAEVSGRDYLDFAGTVDLSAPQGLTGTLLLDPTNIEVVSGANNPAELGANDGLADPGVNNTISNGTINAATANVVLQATNDITVNAPVSIAAPAVGFTATAGNNILVNSSLATNGGSIALNGDQNLDGIGSVLLNTGSSLSSNGGNITVTGRSNAPLSGRPGIEVNGPINSAGGTITLTGRNSNGEDGLRIQNSITSAGGSINLTGACTGPSCVNAEGIFVGGSTISSSGGAITLQGSSTNDEGIQILSNGVINAGAGTLTLITDRLNLIDFGGGLLQGSGNLLLQPLTPSANLTLGGVGNPRTTFLNGAELAKLINGFSAITIGSSTGTGAITLAGNVTFSDPTTLQTLGSINTTGGTLTGVENASLTLEAGGAVITGNISTAGTPIDGRNVTITGATVTTGNIDTSNTGSINTGSIQLTSTNGGIATGFLNTSANLGGNAGDITLNATGGGITNLEAIAFGIQGSGGDITFSTNVGDIVAGNITTTLSSSITPGARGGNVSITVPTPLGQNPGGSDITVGVIDSRGFNSAPGGNVTVTTNSGAVTIASVGASSPFGATGVDASSRSGTAGNVDLRSNSGLLTVNGPINAGAISGTAGSVILRNDSGGMTIGDVTGQSVSANTFTDQPFVIGEVSAVSNIFLANSGGTLTTGNLSATINGIAVSSGFGGAVTLGNATAGTSIQLSTGATGTITTGNLDAGTQLIATTGEGGSLTTRGLSSGPGVFGLSIDLEADEMNFLGGAGSVQAPGRLLIQTAAAGQPIGLGGTDDSGPGTLDLTATDLAALADGFSDIVFGGIFSGIGTGPITLAGDVAFSDPVILRTNGSIDTTGHTLSGADNASLSLEAGAGVTTGAITTAGGAVAIEGDRDDNGAGSVTVNQAITTNGGNITLNGASTTTDITTAGVAITSTTLNSGDGAITITGTSTGSRGIRIADGTINSQGGAISLTGESTTREGVALLPASSISSGGGNISITGISTGTSTESEGVFVNASINSADGNISIEGNNTNDQIAGITVREDATVMAGTGGVTLNTDNPNLLGMLSGTGSLQIQPLTPALPITLGGTGDPDATFLNQGEINRLGNGFSSRTIGEVGNTGPITLEPFALSSPLTIAGGVLTGPSQDTTFAVAPDSSLELGGFGATLRLLNPTEIVGSSGVANTVLGSAGNDTFTIIGDRTGMLGGIRFSNITLFDGRDGFDKIEGTAADDYFVVTSGSGGFTLDSDFIDDIGFTNVEAIATGGGARDVVELYRVPLELAVTGGSGTLVVDSLVIDNQSGITLDADVTTPGDLVISTADGDIAQTGGQVTVGGNTSLNAPGNITLGGSNDFNTVTVTSGQNVTLRDRDSLELNDLAFSGGLQVTADGNLTVNTNLQPGSSTSPMGLFAADSSLFAANSSIPATDSLAGISLTSGGSLTTANIVTFGGPIALRAGGSITSGNLNSSASTGGSVHLQAGGALQVNTINAQGTTSGGSITATTPGTFRAVGSFTNQTGVAASLSTMGGSQGGPITLSYGPTTFTLGDPSFNGTLAAITSGDVTLLPDLANPILGSRTFGRGLPGQVQFISFGEIPVEIEPPPDVLDPTNEPVRNPEALEADAPIFLTSAGSILGQEQFSEAEDSANDDFASYFGDLVKSPRSVNLQQARATLRDIAAQTGEVPAFMYVRLNRDAKPGEGGVELLLITAEGEPSQVRVLNTTAEEVLKTQEQLRRQVTNPSLTNNTAYLTAAQQLYSWLIAPIEAELKAAEVTNIGFIMDAGLRTLPLAALHNGERFLIEDYSIGLIPSLGLIDPTYVALNRQDASLLVSGASQFINQPPLLAAELEMQTLQTLWPGTKVAETSFTFGNLQRDRRQAQIIHMATHAQFLRGAPDNSYLQFFDSRLYLNQVPTLGWFDPQVELVTLSACQTAMGNADAELGFAGFALLAGAKSALASLWKVNDEATAGLMITFYRSLDEEAIKAAALRDAQLAMVRGQIYTENGQLVLPGGSVPLPPELVVDGRQNLRHPFYWAAFTMVGSPW